MQAKHKDIMKNIKRFLRAEEEARYLLFLAGSYGAFSRAADVPRKA
jgi:hypothetical protein